ACASPTAIACCVRIMIASVKPRSSMTRPRARYMTPMRLWSTLVSHSRHRYGHQPFTVTVTSMARMTMPTTAPLSNGSGSLNGIASQLSRPSMSTSGLKGPADAAPFGTCRGPVDDALEQLRFHRAIGRGRHGFARLCQLGVAGIVEGGSGAAHLLKPAVETFGGHRLHDKPHPGEAVAAVVCRKAGILARRVREKIEVRGHAAHRVDLA